MEVSMEKIAIKRLSHSDLTFFACHFDPKNGTKQKAWNLDKKVFIQEMYPVSWGDGKHNVTLNINGPDISPKYTLERKIIKQQKNMRLNGELIHPHVSGADMYNILTSGDYALMVFNGAPFPNEIDIYLISVNSDLDVPLHKEISKQYGSFFNQRASMLQLSKVELKSLLSSSSVTADHPAQSIFDDILLEDVVQGGEESYKKLRKRRRGNPVSASEYEHAKARLSEIGALGERLINEYLSETLDNKKINSYVWESQEDAIAPFDFSMVNKLDETVYIEVKSTSGTFDTKLHISMAELLYAADSKERYDIYRVFKASDEGAKLRVAEGIKAKAQQIIKVLENLPNTVTADSVSISPSFLDFGDEIDLMG